MIKDILYSVTIATAFFGGYLELKLKKQLTQEALQTTKNVGDFGLLNDLSENLERERILNKLPKQMLFKLRLVLWLKFLAIALLVIELFVFHGTR